ncbi:MAG: SpoIIE family protein phosphatase [Fibrobacter sp.]|nr:SpoIIE family protein phosphatase [Fibrobacter sp.]
MENNEFKNIGDESEKDSDLIIARKIQAAMIPESFPVVEGMEVNSLYLPCGAVGGDLFDCIQISDDMFAFLIFDVTGFGISSALISAMAKVCFMHHINKNISPRTVISRVNSEIISNLNADFYLTAFLCYLDLHDNKLTFCNAGHTYPLIYKKKEHECVSLKSQGTCIGVFKDTFFDERAVYLDPGDTLFMFTDGIYRLFSENYNEGRSLFESELTRFLNILSPKEFHPFIKEKCLKTGSVGDDITIMSIEILTLSKRNQIKEKLGFGVDQPVYLQFLSYFEEIDKAVSVILTSMDAYGFQDDSIRKMKIALSELLVNAISHGNQKDFSKKVIMGHYMDRFQIIVSIMDEGAGFDPERVPDPTVPENLIKNCGRGLFIVRHYVDKLEFNEIGNRVTVTRFHTIR